jgi:hypothetical protein
MSRRRSAKAVTLEDVIPSNATLLEGSLTATFPRISEGSSVQHTYTMAFTTGGAGMVLPTASVKYAAEEGSVQVCGGLWSELGVCRWRQRGARAQIVSSDRPAVSRANRLHRSNARRLESLPRLASTS